jgi:hypothetical protein
MHKGRKIKAMLAILTGVLGVSAMTIPLIAHYTQRNDEDIKKLTGDQKSNVQ